MPVHPARAPSSAIMACTNDPVPCFSATMAVKISCSLSIARTSICSRRAAALPMHPFTFGSTTLPLILVLVTALPCLVRLLLFPWRFLIGRSWRSWFSRRGMLRLLCTRRRSRGLGFRFRGWLGGRPVRSRWRRRRFCWLRMSSRLSAPLGSGWSGLVRSRRLNRLGCRRCGLGCRLS